MIPDRPFAPGCAPGSFLETVACGDALRRLDDGLGSREPFLLVTGEPGTGKTALVHEAVRRWGARVTAAHLASPALTGVELLEEILLRFGAEAPREAGRAKLVACLERTLDEIAGRGQVAMIVVDDAHLSSPESLEELRLIAGNAQQSGRPLEVLLAGLPALGPVLDDAALAALRQRISVRATLSPLSVGETRRYLRHRAGAAGGDGAELFPRPTCLEIAALAGGVPRSINVLAAEALRLARAANDPVVRREHVLAAAATLRGDAPADARGGTDDDDADEVVPSSAAAGDRVTPASVAPAATPAPTPAPAAPMRARGRADAPSRETAAVPARAVTSKRAATPAAPSRPADALAASVADAPARPAPTAPQDAREWVARFVGDRGPLQIGSQAMAQSNWASERPEPGAGAGAGTAPAAAPRPHRRPDAAPRPQPRPRHRRGAQVAAGSLLVVAVAIGAVALVLRAGGLARRHDGPAADVTTPAPAPAVAIVQAPPRVERVRPPQPGAAEATASGADAAPGAGAQAPEAAAEREHGPYTLDVGAYLDLREAYDERDRLQEVIGIRSWVVPAPEGSGAPNRVILGVYRTRARADAAAKLLLRSRTLGNVTVAPLPPRRARV